jgi:ATP-dependent RNA helicase RhlE
MGFIHDIKKVLAVLPPKKQSLLFSATFSDEIKALADRLLNQPALIEVARRNATADTIAQKVHPVGRDGKKELLAHLIREGNWHQVLVFTRMKHGANRLAEFLNKSEISAMAIHGNKSQGARTKALADFKSGELQVLVATDIAARGIDIDQLPHVVNFELPNVPEDYVHRIGRTGRAGAQGEAVSLVCPDEELFLRDIEKLIKRQIPRESVSGFDIPAGEKAEPIVLGRMTIGVGGTRRGGGGGGGGGHRGGRGDRPAAHEGRGGNEPRRDGRPAGPSAHKPAAPHGRPGGGAVAHGGHKPAHKPAQANANKQGHGSGQPSGQGQRGSASNGGNSSGKSQASPARLFRGKD